MYSTCPTDSHRTPRRAIHRAWPAGGFLLLALAWGCGENPGSDDGGSGAGGDETSREVVAVVIDSGALVGTRIGQRWALTATALDAFDEPIPDVEFHWDSSESSIANVDTEGLVTAMRRGEARITATAAGHSDSVELTARSAVPSEVGEVYTVWFARSDDAAVAVIDGRLEVFAMYPGAAQPTPPWPHPGVERFQWAGDRLAIFTDVVDGLGTLRVLDRHEEWTVLRVADAMGFQLAGNRVAELGAGGSLRVKEGLHGPWTTLVSTGVEQFQLSGDRIAVVKDDGSFIVKDGIEGEWTELAPAVRAFELHDDRIAVLTDALDGETLIKDGIESPWTTLDEYVKKVALSGNRIGVVRTDGVARVKDGIDGEWKLLANSYVEDLQLDGDRIAILFEGGDLRAKDTVDGSWTVLSTSARRFVLQGNYIGMLTKEGQLWFKIGLEGTWSTVAPAGPVAQFVPVADVPMPPSRTTAASYAESQKKCAQDGPRCEPISDPGPPVPTYGRFCGAGRPLDPDWSWAHGPDGGPIDAFDALCMHHTHATSWYPEGGDGSYGACIMRYGLANARLTRDGTVIGPGTSAYDQIMDEMANLRDAIASYDSYTAGCTLGQLDAFIEATRADH